MKQKNPATAKDYGTPELHRQMQVVIKDGLARITKNVPLTSYFERDRPIITHEQWFAGTRLDQLFVISGVYSMRTARITDEKGIIRHSETESLADSFEKEYRHAIKNLCYATRKVTLNVCCFHQCVEFSPRLISVLKEGLSQLHDTFKAYER